MTSWALLWSSWVSHIHLFFRLIEYFSVPGPRISSRFRGAQFNKIWFCFKGLTAHWDQHFNNYIHLSVENSMIEVGAKPSKSLDGEGAI